MNATVYFTIVIITTVILGITLLTKTRGLSVRSNIEPKSYPGLFFLLIWTALVNMILLLLREHRTILVISLIAYMLCSILFWFLYFRIAHNVRLGPATIGYVPAYVKVWFFKSLVPDTIRTNTTSIIKLKLIEKLVDMNLEIDTTKDIATQLETTKVFHMNKYEEEAMVESGNLRNNHIIVIRVSAPAFNDIRDIQTTIDDLVRSPISIPILPKEDGEHALVFDFFDASARRCGGFSLPIPVSERNPLLSAKALRAVQIIAVVLGMSAGIKLIIDTVRSLI